MYTQSLYALTTRFGVSLGDNSDIKEDRLGDDAVRPSRTCIVGRAGVSAEHECWSQ